MSAKHRRKNLPKENKPATMEPSYGRDISSVRSGFSAHLDTVLSWGLGLLCLFISICFYTGTYDTAFVKITLLQMGGIALTALWFALLAVQKRFPVSKQTLPWLLPFLVYFGWNIIGYCLAPYKMEAFDEFLRYVLYFMIAWMVLDRFSTRSIRILTKFLIVAAWISCLYGLVQTVDRWFPGVDIMPWRGFFGTRVFSTHANPNFFADFAVFTSFIIAAEYLRTKSKWLLALLIIELTDLFFSESKGAWIGFAASGMFFVGCYVNAAERMRKYARKLTVAAAVLVVGVAVLAGIYAAKRFQSVSFRTYTWAAVLDMVQDSPVMGTGVGSFKIIYPAYRKPQIFYIEKIHNNETQHAENEYLEQWATAGTVGLAIFLWLIFFVLYTGVRGLKSKIEKWDEKTWWTLGYMAAFFGICVHNFFDVSIRFVSTGLFFAVFSAVVIRLNMPVEIAEKPEPRAGNTAVLMILQALLFVGLGWLFWDLVTGFYQTVANIGERGIGGLSVQIIGWIVLLGLLLMGVGTYLCISWKSRWIRVPLILLLSIFPLHFVFGFFMADHYYGIAVGFSSHNMFDGALEYYRKAIEKNPFSVSLRQYRSYILRFTRDMQRIYSPVKGDKKLRPGERALNDYERILRELDIVKRRAPNNAMLYQAYGEFYYTYGMYYTHLSDQESLPAQRMEYEQKAIENIEAAKVSFRRSLLLDPVNEATYVYLTNIAMMERNPNQAQEWIDAYRRGPAGVVEEEFLKTHQHSDKLAQLEMRIHQPPFTGWWK